MDDCKKFWFRINKKQIIAQCCAMAVFTVFGGGSILAVIFYAFSVMICCMNFLLEFYFSQNDSYATYLLQTLPLKRSAIYNTYIKMMIMQSIVFTIVFAIGTIIGNFTGILRLITFQTTFQNETVFSNFGCYTVLFCILVFVWIQMVKMINRCTVIRKSMVMIGIFYCTPVWYAFYFIFLAVSSLSQREVNIHRIFAVICVAALCALLAKFNLEVQKNRAKFVRR